MSFRKLNEFVEHSKTDGRNLVFYITYLVIAQNKETKKSRVVLVNQQDYDKTALENKIISKQIYSVQKHFIDVCLSLAVLPYIIIPVDFERNFILIRILACCMVQI